MRSTAVAAAVLAVLALLSEGTAQERTRLNRVIAQLEGHGPVFGLHVPPARAGGRGSPATAVPASERAKAGLDYRAADFYYETDTESDFDAGFPPFRDFVSATARAGAEAHKPFVAFATPLITKTPKILCSEVDEAEGCRQGRHTAEQTIQNISRLLNAGAAGIFFVEVESAAEVRQGLAAMRFASRGGTRPEDVGNAPSFWGMSEEEYRRRADLWPLNPEGELINWTMIESKEGLAHAREIAAVQGIGVLWVGAGTLRTVFSTTNAAGERVVDAAAHEHAVQTVLAACKEFHVPCGYPANAGDVEERMRQGFSVFASGFNEAGKQAVAVGRHAAGRSANNPPIPGRQ